MFVRLSPRACVSWLCEFEYSVGLCFLFLGFPLLHVLSAFIDPTIDRRIIYNDFRSNPYLHFDAGLVPRALGVQLGEFRLFICLFIAVHISCFIYAVSFDSVDKLYVSILLLLIVITRWDTVTITYVRNYKLEFLEID